MSAQASVAAPIAPAALPVAAPAAPNVAPTVPKVSVEEYFALERTSEIRHEYVKGELIPMPGETPKHNRITGNFFVCFDREFEGRNCEVYMESIRLRVSPDQYRYPDILAVCGEAQFDTENPPCLLNPSVIIEVLSPSTQSIDRGEKLAEYRSIPTVTDYVIVAQNRVFVEHCVRENAVRWTITESTDLDAALTLASLDITISLREIYRRTALVAAQETAPSEAAS